MRIPSRRAAVGAALLIAFTGVATVATVFPMATASTPADVTELPWRLANGATLDAGQSLTSRGGGYHLTMQRDGNLVISRLMGGTVLWASNTDGSGASQLRMQSDGNLVLYTAEARAVWASNTEAVEDEGRSTIARLDADGALRLERNGAIVWTTPVDATAPRPPANQPPSNQPVPIPTRTTSRPPRPSV